MKRYGFGGFTIPGKIALPAVVALALLTAAALTGIFTAQAQTPAPKVVNVEIISTPASGTSYTTGEEIRVKVTFDRDVLIQYWNANQRPQLKLSIGAIQNRTAHNVDHELDEGGDDVLIFSYTVTADDHENYGISIVPKFGRDGLISPLSVSSPGRVYLAGGSADADLRIQGESVVTLAYGHRVNAYTPEPPANVRAVQRYSGIYLTWEQPGSIRADYYLIERRFDGDPPPGERPVVIQRTRNGHRLNFNDQLGLYNGATYKYLVQGFQNNRHHSRISQPATITFTWARPCNPNSPKPKVKNGCLTQPTPTPAPTAAPTPAPAASAAPQITAATHNSVTIDWSRMIEKGGSFQVSSTANGFHLSRRTDATVSFTNVGEVSRKQTSFQDTGLSPDTTYTWRLYEDLPNHRYNLMGEVTHTTLADPAASATGGGATIAGAAGSAASDGAGGNAASDGADGIAAPDGSESSGNAATLPN